MHVAAIELLRPCLLLHLQGSLTNLAKVAPAAGISWLVFEQAKTAMAVDLRR